MDLGTLLAVESRGAQLAAILAARPDLAGIWRAAAALREAAASAGMEGLPVSERAIASGQFTGGVADADGPAVRRARAMHRVLCRPGRLLGAERAEAVQAVLRAIEAGRDGGLTLSEDGLRVADLRLDSGLWTDAAEQIVQAGRRLLTHPAPVLLRLTAYADMVGRLLPESHPAAERLLFVQAEDSVRRTSGSPDPVSFAWRPRGGGADPDGLEWAPDIPRAHWVLTPARALCVGGLRSWSGRRDLAERLDATLARDIGMLAPLGRWAQDLDAHVAAGGRRSTRARLRTLICRQPVLDAPGTARALAVTDRTARTLLCDAEADGVLRRITPRNHYRAWAVPLLAEMIAERPNGRRPDNARRGRNAPGGLFTPAEGTGPLTGPTQDLDMEQGTPPARTGPLDRGELDAALDAAFTALDAAVDRADRLLGRLPDRSRRRDKRHPS